MRSSNKPRSRNKSNRNRNHSHNQGGGNVVNRVFDSSGPEGKVRGTPQQIIDKYQSLARDAQLSGDRVAAESFLQHSEHYSRMLGEAQREMNERREAQEAQRQVQEAQRQVQQAAHAAQQAERKQSQQQHQPAVSVSDEQPDVPMDETSELFPGQTGESNLVQTPESRSSKAETAAKTTSRAPRAPRAPRKKPVEKTEVEAHEPAADNPAE
ncbi:MAG: DUF4167 domain-containing protein [Rhodobacteraceae bacterium]|nr:DUF4167 domain-containing protein [Paracoccaceae bacterium]